MPAGPSAGSPPIRGPAPGPGPDAGLTSGRPCRAPRRRRPRSPRAARQPGSLGSGRGSGPPLPLRRPLPPPSSLPLPSAPIRSHFRCGRRVPSGAASLAPQRHPEARSHNSRARVTWGGPAALVRLGSASGFSPHPPPLERASQSDGTSTNGSPGVGTEPDCRVTGSEAFMCPGTPALPGQPPLMAPTQGWVPLIPKPSPHHPGPLRASPRHPEGRLGSNWGRACWRSHS